MALCIYGARNLTPNKRLRGAHSSQTRRLAASGTERREDACRTSMSTGDTASSLPEVRACIASAPRNSCVSLPCCIMRLRSSWMSASCARGSR